MGFLAAYLTVGGFTVLNKLLASKGPLVFTKAELGNGVCTDEEECRLRTEMVNKVADASLISVAYDGGEAKVTVQYVNRGLTQGFMVNEIGMYVRDPDTEEDVLYCYATFGQTPDWISPETTAIYIRKYEIITIVDRVETVQVLVSPTGMVTYDQLDQAVRAATENTGGIVATIPFTIEPREWVDSGSTGTYQKYADVRQEDVLAKSVPLIILDQESLQTAYEAGVCATPESFDGYVRLTSRDIPEADISGTIYMLGKAYSGGGGGSYDLLPATDTRLGGIKVGSGLKFKTDGTTSVNSEVVSEEVLQYATAEDQEFQEMIDEVFTPEAAENEAAPEPETTGA